VKVAVVTSFERASIVGCPPPSGLAEWLRVLWAACTYRVAVLSGNGILGKEKSKGREGMNQAMFYWSGEKGKVGMHQLNFDDLSVLLTYTACVLRNSDAANPTMLSLCAKLETIHPGNVGLLNDRDMRVLRLALGANIESQKQAFKLFSNNSAKRRTEKKGEEAEEHRFWFDPATMLDVRALVNLRATVEEYLYDAVHLRLPDESPDDAPSDDYVTFHTTLCRMAVLSSIRINGGSLYDERLTLRNISTCFQIINGRLNNKALEARVAASIENRLLAYDKAALKRRDVYADMDAINPRIDAHLAIIDAYQKSHNKDFMTEVKYMETESVFMLDDDAYAAERATAPFSDRRMRPLVPAVDSKSGMVSLTSPSAADRTPAPLWESRPCCTTGCGYVITHAMYQCLAPKCMANQRIFCEHHAMPHAEADKENHPNPGGLLVHYAPEYCERTSAGFSNILGPFLRMVFLEFHQRMAIQNKVVIPLIVREGGGRGGGGEEKRVPATSEGNLSARVEWEEIWSGVRAAAFKEANKKKREEGETAFDQAERWKYFYQAGLWAKDVIGAASLANEEYRTAMNNYNMVASTRLIPEWKFIASLVSAFASSVDHPVFRFYDWKDETYDRADGSAQWLARTWLALTIHVDHMNTRLGQTMCVYEGKLKDTQSRMHGWHNDLRDVGPKIFSRAELSAGPMLVRLDYAAAKAMLAAADKAMYSADGRATDRHYTLIDKITTLNVQGSAEDKSVLVQSMQRDVHEQSTPLVNIAFPRNLMIYALNRLRSLLRSTQLGLEKENTEPVGKRKAVASAAVLERYKEYDDRTNPAGPCIATVRVQSVRAGKVVSTAYKYINMYTLKGTVTPTGLLVPSELGQSLGSHADVIEDLIAILSNNNLDEDGMQKSIADLVSPLAQPPEMKGDKKQKQAEVEADSKKYLRSVFFDAYTAFYHAVRYLRDVDRQAMAASIDAFFVKPREDWHPNPIFSGDDNSASAAKSTGALYVRRGVIDEINGYSYPGVQELIKRTKIMEKKRFREAMRVDDDSSSSSSSSSDDDDDDDDVVAVDEGEDTEGKGVKVEGKEEKKKKKQTDDVDEDEDEDEEDQGAPIGDNPLSLVSVGGLVPTIQRIYRNESASAYIAREKVEVAFNKQLQLLYADCQQAIKNIPVKAKADGTVVALSDTQTTILTNLNKQFVKTRTAYDTMNRAAKYAELWPLTMGAFYGIDCQTQDAYLRFIEGGSGTKRKQAPEVKEVVAEVAGDMGESKAEVAMVTRLSEADAVDAAMSALSLQRAPLVYEDFLTIAGWEGMFLFHRGKLSTLLSEFEWKKGATNTRDFMIAIKAIWTDRCISPVQVSTITTKALSNLMNRRGFDFARAVESANAAADAKGYMDKVLQYSKSMGFTGTESWSPIKWIQSNIRAVRVHGKSLEMPTARIIRIPSLLPVKIGEGQTWFKRAVRPARLNLLFEHLAQGWTPTGDEKPFGERYRETAVTWANAMRGTLQEIYRRSQLKREDWMNDVDMDGKRMDDNESIRKLYKESVWYSGGVLMRALLRAWSSSRKHATDGVSIQQVGYTEPLTDDPFPVDAMRAIDIANANWAGSVKTATDEALMKLGAGAVLQKLEVQKALDAVAKVKGVKPLRLPSWYPGRERAVRPITADIIKRRLWPVNLPYGIAERFSTQDIHKSVDRLLDAVGLFEDDVMGMQRTKWRSLLHLHTQLYTKRALAGKKEGNERKTRKVVGATLSPEDTADRDLTFLVSSRISSDDARLILETSQPLLRAPVELPSKLKEDVPNWLDQCVSTYSRIEGYVHTATILQEQINLLYTSVVSRSEDGKESWSQMQRYPTLFAPAFFEDEAKQCLKGKFSKAELGTYQVPGDKVVGREAKEETEEAVAEKTEEEKQVEKAETETEKSQITVRCMEWYLKATIYTQLMTLNYMWNKVAATYVFGKAIYGFLAATGDARARRVELSSMKRAVQDNYNSVFIEDIGRMVSYTALLDAIEAKTLQPRPVSFNGDSIDQITRELVCLPISLASPRCAWYENRLLSGCPFSVDEVYAALLGVDDGNVRNIAAVVPSLQTRPLRPTWMQHPIINTTNVGLVREFARVLVPAWHAICEGFSDRVASRVADMRALEAYHIRLVDLANARLYNLLNSASFTPDIIKAYILVHDWYVVHAEAARTAVAWMMLDDDSYLRRGYRNQLRFSDYKAIQRLIKTGSFPVVDEFDDDEDGVFMAARKLINKMQVDDVKEEKEKEMRPTLEYAAANTHHEDDLPTPPGGIPGVLALEAHARNPATRVSLVYIYDQAMQDVIGGAFTKKKEHKEFTEFTESVSDTIPLLRAAKRRWKNEIVFETPRLWQEFTCSPPEVDWFPTGVICTGEDTNGSTSSLFRYKVIRLSRRSEETDANHLYAFNAGIFSVLDTAFERKGAKLLAWPTEIKLPYKFIDDSTKAALVSTSTDAAVVAARNFVVELLQSTSVSMSIACVCASLRAVELWLRSRALYLPVIVGTGYTGPARPRVRKAQEVNAASYIEAMAGVKGRKTTAGRKDEEEDFTDSDDEEEEKEETKKPLPTPFVSLSSSPSPPLPPSLSSSSSSSSSSSAAAASGISGVDAIRKAVADARMSSRDDPGRLAYVATVVAAYYATLDAGIRKNLIITAGYLPTQQKFTSGATLDKITTAVLSK